MRADVRGARLRVDPFLSAADELATWQTGVAGEATAYQVISPGLFLALVSTEARPWEESVYMDPTDRTSPYVVVLARAREVLGDPEAARVWIITQNRSLGGQVPLSLIRTNKGRDQVMEALGRLEAGVVG